MEVRETAQRWGGAGGVVAVTGTPSYFLLSTVMIKLHILRTGKVREEFSLFTNNCNISYHQIPKLTEGTPQPCHRLCSVRPHALPTVKGIHQV